MQVNLQRRPNEHVACVMTSRLTHRAVTAQTTICARKKHIGPGPDIGLHSRFRAEGMDGLNPPGFDRRNECWVWIKRPVFADFPLQTQ